MSIKKHIPNLITLGNLMCGVESIFASLVAGDVRAAAVWICAGIFLDFFDGLAARLLKVPSELGKQLDSLADVVTSGIAPAFIMFRLVEEPLRDVFPMWAVGLVMLPFVLMPAFAAYRLAKFNIDPRQGHSFLGLPVPSNALIWVGLALAVPASWCAPDGSLGDLFYQPVAWFDCALAVVALATDILMVSEMPMFSLKVDFSRLGWRDNRVPYIFLIGCVVLIVAVRQWYALSLVILWYILLSAFTARRHAS